MNSSESFRDLPDLEYGFDLMPRGPDWLTTLPPRIRDGEDGVDLRLVRDLAKAGYKTYRLSPLSNMFRTMPTAIPVFVDWIEHIDERIPEPRRTRSERDHKDGIWIGLNKNLVDPAAKGNRHAVDVLFEQFAKPWCPVAARHWGARALDMLATKADYDRMVALLDNQPEGVRAPVAHYLGRFRTDRSHDLLVHLLHNDPDIIYETIPALARMKRREDIEVLTPYLDHPISTVRAAAQKAIAKLEKSTA